MSSLPKLLTFFVIDLRVERDEKGSYDNIMMQSIKAGV
jgi:hypothetical protein